MRYAGDDFLEKIDNHSDLEAYYIDASSIPVRLDGRGNTNFVKLSYDKQKRSYTRSARASSIKGLEHNDLIGVYLSGNNPDYILRVVQMAPEDDLSANMFLELQAARLSGLSTTDPKSVIGGGISNEYPALRSW